MPWGSSIGMRQDDNLIRGPIERRRVGRPTMNDSPDRAGATADARAPVPQGAASAAAVLDDAGFDLLANPFILFRVAADASAQTIKDAYEDAVEDGVAPADVLARALQCLLSPKLRVDAEVGGLLDVDPGLAGRVVAKLRSGADRATMADEIAELHALPKSNLLAHLGARSPNLDAMLDLLQAQASVAAGGVVEAIGEARDAAGAAKADRPTVELALAQLAERQAKAVVYASSGDAAFAANVSTLVERVLSGQDAAAIDKLDMYLRVYGLAAASELSRRREKIAAACEAQRKATADQRATEQIIAAVAGWIDVARPLQLYESHLNRDEAASQEVFLQVRGLWIWLCNERRRYPTARRLTQACAELFRLLPRALAQVREDLLVIERTVLQSEFDQANSSHKFRKAIAIVDQMLERETDEVMIARLREAKEELGGKHSRQIVARSIAAVLAVMFLIGNIANLTNATKRAAPTGYGTSRTYMPGPPSTLSYYPPAPLSPSVPTGYGRSFSPSAPTGSVGNRVAPPISPTYMPAAPSAQHYFLPAPLSPQSSGTAAAGVGASADLAEEMPDRGSVLATRGNVRYCEYQRVRIDAMRPMLKTRTDLDEIGRRVGDREERCAHLRYRLDDRSAVDGELPAARARLGAEGRAIVERWRHDGAAGPDTATAR